MEPHEQSFYETPSSLPPDHETLEAPTTEPEESAQIEDYLDHVCAPLVGLATYEERQRLRAELRDHILSTIEACRELDGAPQDAVRESLAQLGNPDLLGRQYARHWQRVRRGIDPSARSLAISLASFGLACAWGFAFAGSRLPMWGASFNYGDLLVPVGEAAPLLAGVLAGFAAPQRPILSAFYAISACIGLTFTLSQTLPYPWDWFAWNMTLVQGICWIPLGCASSALGSWLRRSWPDASRRWTPA